MRICMKCVLPETFPGIRFNEDGLCNYCLEFKGEKDLEEKKQRYHKKFDDLVKAHKGESGYDTLVSYSGGKDSTFTLSLLKEEYGLNILAMTFDNGFLPAQTVRNIRIVSEKLGFDHIFYKPRFDVLSKVFLGCTKENIFPPQNLVRASAICVSCMSFVKFIALRIALEKSIPFIVFGWSPGQIPVASSIMKNNPEMAKAQQKALFDPLYQLAGEEIKPYFLEERHFTGDFHFPFNISPLAFFDYNEEEILRKVRRLGWRDPKDVDSNSTNCQLNSLANVLHKKTYAYHPYAFEMAKLVREGYTSRREALEKLNRPEDDRVVRRIMKKLGM